MLEALTPVMSITTMIISIAWERLWVVLPTSPYFAGLEHCLLSAGVILVAAVIAFGMVWCEYEVRALHLAPSLGFSGGGFVRRGEWQFEIPTRWHAALLTKCRVGTHDCIGHFVRHNESANAGRGKWKCRSPAQHLS